MKVLLCMLTIFPLILCQTTVQTNQSTYPHWSEWLQWSGCPPECSTVVARNRTRYCVSEGVSKDQQGNCSGVHSETKDCFSSGNCTVPGHWMEWLPWSSCIGTCDLGLKTRNRECEILKNSSGSAPIIGLNCTGFSHTSRHCALDACDPGQGSPHEQDVPEGTLARLYCAYPNRKSTDIISWVTPSGINVTSENKYNGRYTIIRNYLFIKHAGDSDNGVHRCIIHQAGDDKNITGNVKLVVLTCEDGLCAKGECIESESTGSNPFVTYQCVCPRYYKGVHCEKFKEEWRWIIVVAVMVSLVVILAVIFLVFCKKKSVSANYKWGDRQIIKPLDIPCGSKIGVSDNLQTANQKDTKSEKKSSSHASIDSNISGVGSDDKNSQADNQNLEDEKYGSSSASISGNCSNCDSDVEDKKNSSSSTLLSTSTSSCSVPLTWERLESNNSLENYEGWNDNCDECRERYMSYFDKNTSNASREIDIILHDNGFWNFDGKTTEENRQKLFRQSLPEMIQAQLLDEVRNERKARTRQGKRKMMPSNAYNYTRGRSGLPREFFSNMQNSETDETATSLEAIF